MPLYEYECEACHRRTEKIQKFSDAELTVCPFCGGALARTITAPAIQFKGAGWYKDLYSSAKPAAAGGASGEGSTAGSGNTEGASGASGGSGEAASKDKPAGKGESNAPSAPAPASGTPAVASAAPPASKP